MKKMYISSDHAGFEMKNQIIDYVKNKYQIEVQDLGPFNTESVSYAEYGKLLAQSVVKDKAQDVFGIGLCGTGLGISYAVNRIKGIRGARVTSKEDAMLAKLHNNANILLFGARQESFEEIKAMIDTYITTEYEGGRHQARIDELDI